jgi:uncharacterized protein
MRLFFDEITEKSQQYSITDSLWFPASEECSAVATTATIRVYRKDQETVFLKGGIEGKYKVFCDRCCEPYEEHIQSDFVYLATIKKQAIEVNDHECTEEDALVLYLDEPVIEIDHILREQALLAFPLKKLCREDCRGICPDCGCVLSKDLCRCQSDKKYSSFAVLKTLLNQ